MNRHDVVVLGAGPAGSIASTLLARAGFSVLLLHRATRRRLDNPEVLSPDGVRWLRAHRLQHALTTPKRHCRGWLCRWEGEDAEWRDQDLQTAGPGWVIDREQFDERLRRDALAAGAVLRPADGSLGEIIESANGTRLHSRTATEEHTITCRFLLEAAGRFSVSALSAGRRARLYWDQQVAVVVQRVIAGDLGLLADAGIMGATRCGWYYAIACPDRHCVTTAFLTEAATLPRDRSISNLAALVSRQTADDGELSRICADSKIGDAIVVDARLACRRVFWEDDWMPIGSAAFTSDPLAGAGLLHAFVQAERSAEAVAEYLRHGTTGDLRYAAKANVELFSEHLAGRRRTCAQNVRWPDAEFWCSRRASPFPVETGGRQPFSSTGN